MIYYLSLGSNKGDRGRFLQRAFSGLEQFGNISGRSRIYETEPVGFLEQASFLNAVCVLESNYRPFRLLRKLKQIETRLGRQRNRRWGAREIDIDIIDCNGETVQSRLLIIPHIMMEHRAFVLQPLAEAAPDYINRDGHSAAQLLYALNEKAQTRKLVSINGNK